MELTRKILKLSKRSNQHPITKHQKYTIFIPVQLHKPDILTAAAEESDEDMIRE